LSRKAKNYEAMPSKTAHCLCTSGSGAGKSYPKALAVNLARSLTSISIFFLSFVTLN